MDLPLLTISLVLVLVVLTTYKLFGFKLPPGPRPWPVVGNYYQVKLVRFRCFAEWAEVYGPIMSVWLGSTLNVVVSNAELAKEVLKDKDQQVADRDRNRIVSRFSSEGKDLIWADYGPHYVKLRKLCNLELFSAKRLHSLTPIREDEVTAMVHSIFNHFTNSVENSGKSMVVREHLGPVAFNNITRLAFGKRFVNSEGILDDEGLEFKAIIANGAKINRSLSVAEYVPWLRWMFPLEEAALANHAARRDNLTKQIMADHTQARHTTGATNHHFVDALLTLQHQYHLTEDTIVGLLWDMITAGMDTVSISVEWAMAELIKNPRVQQKSQEELDRVIGSERVMTESDFSSLPYLQAVAKEALRLHPPTPLMLPHKSNSNLKIGGYDVPKGSVVHVNVWAIGRDPAIWKSPTEFRPERFLEEDVDMKGHDFRLLPFGAGRRVCPGTQFGINLVMSMLGHLLHQFRWAPPEGMEPEEIDLSESPGLVTYMRTPLKVVPIPRLPSHLYCRLAADM